MANNSLVLAAPIAQPDTYTVTEDVPLTVAGPGLLANDLANDVAAMNAVLATPPTKGSVVIAQNGGFTYTPNANANGADQFTYKATEAVSPVLFTVDQPDSVLTVAVTSTTYVTSGTTSSATRTTTVTGSATALLLPPSSPLGSVQIQKLDFTLADRIEMTLCVARLFICLADVTATVPANALMISMNTPIEKNQAGPAVVVGAGGVFTQIGNKVDTMGQIMLDGSAAANLITIPPTVDINTTDRPYDFTNAVLTQTGSALRLAVPVDITETITESGDPAAPGQYRVVIRITGTVYADAAVPVLQESAPVTVTLSITPTDDPPVAAGDRYYTRQFNTINIPATSAMTTQTAVAVRSAWKYSTGADLGTTWRGTTFNDTAWASASGYKGYGDTDIPSTGIVPARANMAANASTSNPNYPTCYFRKTVQLTNIYDTATPRITLMRDDAAIVFFNGTEIYRDSTKYVSTSANAPLAASGEIAYATYAAESIPEADEVTFKEITFSRSLLREGTNVIAVAVKQASATSSDLRFDATFSLTKGVNGLLSNDTDIDGDAMATALQTAPANGRVTVFSDGSFRYAAAPGFAGTENFTYLIMQNGTPTVASRSLIAAGSSWLVLNPTENLDGTTWKNANHDETGWTSGATPMGYNYADIANPAAGVGVGTTLSFGADAANKPITYYFRKKFTLPVAKIFANNLTLRLRRDDGAAIWLNGVEVVRENLPGALGDGMLTNTSLGGPGNNQGPNDLLTFNINAQYLVDGENQLAVELHQRSPDSSDVVFNLAADLNYTVGARVELIVQPDDADGDGLSDVWETTFNLNTAANDAALDADGDGSTNLAEFYAGTHPRDGQSLLKIQQVTRNTQGVVTLGFPSIAGVSYQAQCSSNLLQWQDVGFVFTLPTSPAGTTNVPTVPNCPFYRLRVVPPWE